MTLPKMKRYEEFDSFFDEAVAALKAKNKVADRKLADNECGRVFEELYAEQLLAEYERSAPPEETGTQHYAEFHDFQTWCKGARTTWLPARSEVIGAYILRLFMIAHKSLAELKSAADGIVFVHEQAGHHVDPVPLRVAFDVAAEIASGGDDGGAEGVTPAEPLPPTNHEQLPLAAGA